MIEHGPYMSVRRNSKILVVVDLFKAKESFFCFARWQVSLYRSGHRV